MTVFEFRSEPQLVAELRKVFEIPVLKMWMEAFNADENPANAPAREDITPHGAYILLGEQTGWNQYRIRFLLGAQQIEKPPDEGEQSYADAPIAETAEE